MTDREFITSLMARAAEVDMRRPKRKPSGTPEEDMQIKCIEWFDREYPDLRLALHHSPNEGKRSERIGARLKAAGMRAGYPDLTLCMPSADCHGLWLELKTKTGTLSKEQKKYRDLAPKLQWKYVVIRSLEEFQSTIKQYLLYGK